MPRHVIDDELKGFVPLDQAIAESVFYIEFATLKEELKDQKNLSMQIIIGVVVAFVFTVGLAAIDVMFAHINQSSEITELRRELEDEIYDLQTRLLDI